MDKSFASEPLDVRNDDESGAVLRNVGQGVVENCTAIGRVTKPKAFTSRTPRRAWCSTHKHIHLWAQFDISITNVMVSVANVRWVFKQGV